MENKEFNLKAELKSIGLNLKTFANIVELKPNTVSRWVRGEIATPKWVKPFIINYRKAQKLDYLSSEICNCNNL